MRKTIKQLVLLVSMISITVMLQISVVSAAGIDVIIDDIVVTFTQVSGQPFIDSSNRTQVPLRQTMEAYECTVSWDSINKIATVEKDGLTVKVPIGKNYIIKNGEATSIDTAAQIVSNRTYLPIRPVLEAFGATVNWEPTQQKVIINSAKVKLESSDIDDSNSLQEYLNENYNSVDTPIGTWKLKYMITDFEDMSYPYDYLIKIEYDGDDLETSLEIPNFLYAIGSKSIYMGDLDIDINKISGMYIDNPIYEETRNDLKDFTEDLADFILGAVPNKKILCKYYDGFRAVPDYIPSQLHQAALDAGVSEWNEITFLSWANYSPDTYSGFYSHIEDNTRITSFHWFGLNDEYNLIDEVQMLQLKFDTSYFKLAVGESMDLSEYLIISPDEAANYDIIWESSNPEILHVDSDGTATAIKKSYSDVMVWVCYKNHYDLHELISVGIE